MLKEHLHRFILLASSLALLATSGCASRHDDLTTSDLSSMSHGLAGSTGRLEDPPAGPMDLADAIARAIKYNADIGLQRYSVALAATKVRAQTVAMLPNAVVQDDFAARNNLQLTHSNLSPVNSYSVDAKDLAGSLTLSWNVLDFGLAYFRSLQEADRAAKEKEELRRVVGRVVEDTRAAYWRSIAYQHLSGRLAELEPEVTAMLGASNAAIADNRVDPLVSLSYDRDMLNMRRELNELLTNLAGAPQQLRQLAGLPQSYAMRLRTGHLVNVSPLLARPVQNDVLTAFQNRFEIRQAMYDQRITGNEVYTTLAQLLPGLSLSGGLNRDSNSFLLNPNWLSWGSAISWNLINLVQLPHDLDVIHMQQSVNRQQTIAMAISIAMQVHIAKARLAVMKRAAADADALADVQRKLLHQVEASADVGTIAPQLRTKERLATLLAIVRADLAHADLENAVGVYLTSIGKDPLSDMDIRNSSVAQIALAIKQGSNLAGIGPLASVATAKKGSVQ